jgi:four helix bundle protein
MVRSTSTHKDLDVWQLAMDLVVEIYVLTRGLPGSEKFGLLVQMRRAAVSVPSNIAEGAARNSTAEFARYLSIAKGSISELETQVELVRRLDLCSVKERVMQLLIRVRQMLIALIRKLTKSS